MWKPSLSTLTIAALVVASIGCAHVPREDFETEISRLEEQQEQLRRDAESEDALLAERIESVESDVTAVDERVDAIDRRIEAVRADLTQLENDYGVTVERLEGMLAFDVPVHFEYDSDVVREDDKPVLDRFAAVAEDHYPASLITVEGFADPAGSETYNLELGRRRAEAVASHLEDAGLGGERLRTVSYGEAAERQVLPGAWGDDGLPNRRVTLVIETAGAEWDLTTDAASDPTTAPVSDARESDESDESSDQSDESSDGDGGGR